MIVPLLFFAACVPGEVIGGLGPPDIPTVEDVTQVTITPEKPALGTDEMIRIRVRGKTDNGDEMTLPMDWSTDGGSITQTSNNEIYFSSTSAGSFKVVGRGRNKNKPVDSTVVVVTQPISPIVSVTVSPDPSSVYVGYTQSFTASGLRSDGTSASPAVTWSATGGTISSGGVYVAGGTTGSFQATATTSDALLMDAAAVSVTPAPQGGPNEPAGFSVIFEKNFSSIPGTAGGDLHGTSSRLGRGGDTTMTIFQDPSAPYSASGTLQTWFPKGLRSGFEPGAWWFWGQYAGATPGSLEEYREVYLSFRAKIPTPDFENQAVLTKLIYFAHGGDGTVARNDDFIGLQGPGTGSNGVMTAMKVAFYTSQADDRTGQGSGIARQQNVNVAKTFTAGSWHLVELYAKVGTADRYDGIAKVWIDGVLVTEYTNLKFLDSRYGYTHGFYEAQFTPVWGGENSTAKTRDDYLLFDHIYLSGRP